MTTPLKSGFILLLGLPNAGKSSLLNSLVGSELAIVTPKAQTTRTLLRGYVQRPELEAVVTDTPGLQEGTKALNAALAKNAARALTAAREGGELVALVIDAAEIGRRLRDRAASKSKDWKPLGLEAIGNVLARDCGSLPLKLSVLPTLSKSDLVRKPEHRAEIERIVVEELRKLFHKVQAPVWVSVKSGEGLSGWLDAVAAALPVGNRGELFEDDVLTDQSVRDIAGELVREQCFMQLGAEIPYSIAVQIESFKEDNALTRIEAVLHVERDSQKAVVLGAKGAKIKSIGTKARERIEKLVGTKVFLGLKVKVTPHWAREARWVERFGYGKAGK